MRLSILFLTSLLLVSCAPEPKKAIRIGINAWPGYEFLSLAEQLGYFKEEGVEVRLVTFQTLADGRRAFEKGQVDVMGGTLMELYTARDSHGVEPVAIMMADFSNGGDMLLANKAFSSVAELKGKKNRFRSGFDRCSYCCKCTRFSTTYLCGCGIEAAPTA